MDSSIWYWYVVLWFSYRIWYRCITTMIDANKDKQDERDHLIVERLKEHYIGTDEHISDCSVCAFLKPIMEGKK